MRNLLVLLFVALSSLAACGEGSIGEECDTEGKVDGECDDGAVCGKRGTSLVCLKQCTTQADCSSDEDCNGVSGTSLKGCRPR